MILSLSLQSCNQLFICTLSLNELNTFSTDVALLSPSWMLALSASACSPSQPGDLVNVLFLMGASLQPSAVRPSKHQLLCFSKEASGRKKILFVASILPQLVCSLGSAMCLSDANGLVALLVEEADACEPCLTHSYGKCQTPPQCIWPPTQSEEMKHGGQTAASKPQQPRFLTLEVWANLDSQGKLYSVKLHCPQCVLPRSRQSCFKSLILSYGNKFQELIKC